MSLQSPSDLAYVYGAWSSVTPADHGTARARNQLMGAIPGVVQWIEHSANPQVVLHGLKHQQAAIKDNLERPVVEAGECEGHDANFFGLVTPSPKLTEPLLMGINRTCDLGQWLETELLTPTPTAWSRA